MRYTKPNLKKINLQNPKKFLGNKKYLAAFMAGILLVSAGGAYLYKINQRDATAELLAQIQELRIEGDCSKGLNQLSEFDTRAGDLNNPETQEQVAAVLQYRLDCSYILRDYTKALIQANELMQFYNEHGGTQHQKDNLTALMNSLKTTHETERIDSINEEESRNAKEVHDGPVL